MAPTSKIFFCRKCDKYSPPYCADCDRTIIKLKRQISELQEALIALEEKVTILMYAPPGQGGPEYEAAKHHFDTLSS